jgi:hypothetical protein
VFEKPVFLLRAEEGRLKELTHSYIPKRLPEDRKAAFISTASVYVVNRKSCEELRKMVEN